MEKYANILEGQKKFMENAAGFVTDFSAMLTSNKNTGAEMCKALKNTEKETDSYLQCIDCIIIWYSTW